MTSPETFWDLYEPLLTAAASIEVIIFHACTCAADERSHCIHLTFMQNFLMLLRRSSIHLCISFSPPPPLFFLKNSFLPLPGLESFCNNQLLFAPFFADLSSSIVPPSIPPSLLLTLFPAIPFAHLRFIQDSLRAPPTGKSSAVVSESPVAIPLSPKAVEDVIKAVSESITVAGPDLVEIACGDVIICETEVVSHDHNAEQSLVARNWKLLTTLLCLAHSSLQECQLTSRNPLVCTMIILCIYMHSQNASWCIL